MAETELMGFVKGMCMHCDAMTGEDWLQNPASVSSDCVACSRRFLDEGGESPEVAIAVDHRRQE